MFTEMKTRKYTKTFRAEQQQQTRTQIVEAAMTLHEELGPANTTIKAVAEKAGVQRLTVYRHFPDEFSLFQACTSHWLELHPPPQISDWDQASTPQDRCRAALSAFYLYYGETEKMWHVSYRDVEKVEALQEPMSRVESYLDVVAKELVSALKPDRKNLKPVSATVRHCLRFGTWQSLRAEKLSEKQMVDLVMQWIGSAMKSGE